MAVTSTNTDRRSASAMRRRATYVQRCATARSDRDRLHALVWWWLSEIRKQPKKDRPAAIKQLEALTAELNEGGAR